MKQRIITWLVVSIAIGGFLSLFASSHPDGFEKAGEETGYIETATSYLSSPMPDYTIPGVDSWISSSVAGIIGVLITFGLFVLLGRPLARKEK